jgi:hypothetical protein
MERCIGGNAQMKMCASSAETLEIACSFISENSSVVQEISNFSNKMFCYIGLDFQQVRNCNKYNSMASIIDKIKCSNRQLKEEKSNLLLITIQGKTDVVDSLQAQKKRILSNHMSSIIWTDKMELQLKEEIKKCSMGNLYLLMI